MNLAYPFQMVIIGLLTLVVSFSGISFLRRWAERRQIYDIPNARSSHTRPIPRGGGLAIVFFSLVGFIIAWLLNPVWPLSMVIPFLIGSVLIASVSWIDDLRPLANRVRFAAHSGGAVLAIIGFRYWDSVEIPLIGEFQMGWLGFFVTFMWVVGLTNAYNFMDGIDGIAGGQAVVAGVGWVTLGTMSGQPLVGILGLLLAMSSLGFLGHNWPPARFFMGDVGSAFLGYSFAVLAVVAAQNNPSLAIAGVLLVWPFVFDTIFTFIRRLRRGENVFAAHRSHLYQRLIIAGYSHQFVTLLYIGLAFAGLILALIWYLRAPGGPAIVSFTLPALCAALWGFVTRTEQKISKIKKI